VETQGGGRRARWWWRPLVAPSAQRPSSARDGPERGHADAQNQFRGSRLRARHTRRHARHRQGVQEKPHDQLQQGLQLRGEQRQVQDDVTDSQSHRSVRSNYTIIERIQLKFLRFDGFLIDAPHMHLIMTMHPSIADFLELDSLVDRRAALNLNSFMMDCSVVKLILHTFCLNLTLKFLKYT